jgi:hypothetical protein
MEILVRNLQVNPFGCVVGRACTFVALGCNSCFLLNGF